MGSDSRGFAELCRAGARRSLALATLLAFFAALPASALAHAAEPLTLGEWKRMLFVTPDRKIDRSNPAVATAPPVPPPVVLQTSSEQIPPQQPVVRDRIPDAWLRRDPWKPRKRNRAGQLR